MTRSLGPCALLIVLLLSACGGRIAEVPDANPPVVGSDAEPALDASPPPPTSADGGAADGKAPASEASVDPTTGPSCATVGRSDVLVASTCDATSSYIYGGELAPGTYDLAGVAEIASFETCKSRQPVTYRGSLVVKAYQDGTFFLDERLVEAGSPARGERTGTATLSALRLSFHPTCGPSTEDDEVLYTSDPGSSTVKPWIAYERHEGSRTFVVRWVRR